MYMRLTPLEIYQMEFKKGFRGYETSEVDEFKSKVGKDYETLTGEHRNLKEEVARLKEQMKDYIEMEKTLKQTLVAAQKSSGDTRMNAEKEAELIIKQAEMNAEKLIEDARLEARDILREIHTLKKQKKMLKIELKNVLDSYYAILQLEKEESSESAETATKTPTRRSGLKKK